VWPTQAGFAWVGICGAGGEIIARVNLQFPTFAVHFIASHPSAQNALGWGTPRCEWRTQDKKTSVGRPPGYTTIPLARVCVFQSRNVGGFQPAPKGSVMTKFEVLSINPKTKSPELMRKRPKWTVLLSVHESVKWTLGQESD